MTLTVIWLLPLVASLLIAFMPPRLAKSMASSIYGQYLFHILEQQG